MTPPDELRRRKLLKAAFRMPSVQKIVSRKSSVTNAFVNALIPPPVKPGLDEIEKALEILGMEPTDVRCAYCGNKKTEWDHLRPLVDNHRPTGYISEIANLVPSCNKCNQSKGNSDWREWMLGTTAEHSPTTRGIPDLVERMARLEAYEKWLIPTRINFKEVLGEEAWDEYWRLRDALNADMIKCQAVADTYRNKIAESLQRK